jgi:hypothetical protein
VHSDLHSHITSTVCRVSKGTSGTDCRPVSSNSDQLSKSCVHRLFCHLLHSFIYNQGRTSLFQHGNLRESPHAGDSSEFCHENFSLSSPWDFSKNKFYVSKMILTPSLVQLAVLSFIPFSTASLVTHDDSFQPDIILRATSEIISRDCQPSISRGEWHLPRPCA